MKKSFISVAIFSLMTLSLFAEKIMFSAGSMSGQTGSNNSTTKLSGNAFIQTETMEINADSIELSGDDYRFIKAEGSVKGKNLESKMEFSCDSMNYDRDTKVALLQGNVSMTDTENDVKANAQIIEYNQDTDIAVLQIDVKLQQKENICSGAYAVYQKEAQLLEISGNAQVKQKDDTFRAQQIIFNMDTEDITLSGNVKGSVVDSGKNDKEETKPETSEVTEESVPEAESEKMPLLKLNEKPKIEESETENIKKL